MKRGPDRIRTDVEAFAELCLATRPQDHFDSRKNKLNTAQNNILKTGICLKISEKIICLQQTCLLIAVIN